MKSFPLVAVQGLLHTIVEFRSYYGTAYPAIITAGCGYTFINLNK